MNLAIKLLPVVGHLMIPKTNMTILLATPFCSSQRLELKITPKIIA